MNDDLLLFYLNSEFREAYHRWELDQPARNGMHAYPILDSDNDFCTRRMVLGLNFPGERQDQGKWWTTLAKFAHGWAIHTKWQHHLLKRSGWVLQNSQGQYELDLTHIGIEDIYFSPDIILQVGDEIIPVEIKGINTLDYQGTPALYKRVYTHLVA